MRNSARKHTECLKRTTRVVVVLFIVLFAIFSVLVSFAAKNACAVSADDAKGAGIQNRYKLLQDLEGKGTHAEGNIVETRTSVLTSVNRALDGRIIAFDGEAIGEVLKESPDKCWVNILGDDGAMIGVEMTEEEASQIKNFGDYHTKGSNVHIEGLYSVACKEHQGELDVHATAVRVLDGGNTIDHQYYFEHIPVILIGFALIVLMMGAYFFLRKKAVQKEKKKHKHAKRLHIVPKKGTHSK